MSGTVVMTLPAGGRQRQGAPGWRGGYGTVPALPEEGLAAGPVADDVQGVEVVGIAGGVQEALASRGRAFPRPPAGVVVERRGFRGELVLEPIAALDELRDGGRALRLCLARVGVVLPDVRGHGRLRR